MIPDHVEGIYRGMLHDPGAGSMSSVLMVIPGQKLPDGREIKTLEDVNEAGLKNLLYWSIGGNHTREARHRVCRKVADGDWQKLFMRHMTRGGLEVYPYRTLCVTVGAVCIGLTVAQARLVRPPHPPNHRPQFLVRT